MITLIVVGNSHSVAVTAGSTVSTGAWGEELKGSHRCLGQGDDEENKLVLLKIEASSLESGGDCSWSRAYRPCTCALLDIDNLAQPKLLCLPLSMCMPLLS
jgi:hypothetical protein